MTDDPEFAELIRDVVRFATTVNGHDIETVMLSGSVTTVSGGGWRSTWTASVRGQNAAHGGTQTMALTSLRDSLKKQITDRILELERSLQKPSPPAIDT